MKILMVSSESVPFSKSGGLADVVGSLSAALHDLQAEVHVLLPLLWQWWTPRICTDSRLSLVL